MGWLSPPISTCPLALHKGSCKAHGRQECLVWGLRSHMMGRPKMGEQGTDALIQTMRRYWKKRGGGTAVQGNS